MHSASERDVGRTVTTPAVQHDLHGFILTLDCDAASVRNAIEELSERLGEQGLGTEETGTVQIVLAEVLNNVLEHAYTEDQRSGRVSVHGDWQTDGLHVSVRDTGRPMPGGAPPTGKLPAVDVQRPDLPEGGFGWFLIRDLAKDVVYRRVDGENVLSFRLDVIPEFLRPT